MRIRHNPLLVTKSLTKNTIKKLSLASLATVLVAGGVLLAQNLTTPDQAMAATPPDSCFAFNAATNTITDYYDHEGNNPANPACPRAVDIPSTIGGVAVTAIGNNAFQSNQLTSVTIPSSVTTIGNYAFRYNQLTSVDIPASVTTIGNYAFQSNQLTSVTVPSSVTTIGNYAFYINQLTSITIDGDPTNIGAGVLSGNPIESISYNGVSYDSSQPVGESCYGFSAGTITDFYQADIAHIKTHSEACLKHDIDIPGTIGGVAVTAIGGDAFDSNQLTSVSIPSSVTTINYLAFSSNNLTSVDIPSSVTYIGNSAFYDNKLTSVTLPNTITEIVDSVFAFNSLTSVTIPSSVQSIDPAAFVMQTQWGGVIDKLYPGEPSIWSSDINTVQMAYDGMWYVRLITEDPSNPNNLTTTILNENYWIGSDKNGDGINNSLGGHIVNPAQLTTNYRSSGGDTLKPSQTYTGIYNGEYLTDYMVSNGPIIDGPADVSALAAYYHIGDQATITPPTIPTYLNPPAKTFTLTNSTNQGTFTYKKPLTTVNFSQPSGSATNPTASSVPSGISAALAGSTFTTDETEQCSAIDTARLLPASDFTAPTTTTASGTTNYTTLGGLDFTLSCTEPGKDAKVSLALASEVSDPTTVKVYKQTASGTVTDITNQTTITNQAGKTTISYNLTDGGELDDDGAVNGTITDPVYVAVPADSETLANTGTSQYLSAALAIVILLLAGSIVSVLHVRRRAAGNR